MPLRFNRLDKLCTGSGRALTPLFENGAAGRGPMEMGKVAVF